MFERALNGALNGIAYNSVAAAAEHSANRAFQTSFGARVEGSKSAYPHGKLAQILGAIQNSNIELTQSANDPIIGQAAAPAVVVDPKIAAAPVPTRQKPQFLTPKM